MIKGIEVEVTIILESGLKVVLSKTYPHNYTDEMIEERVNGMANELDQDIKSVIWNITKNSSNNEELDCVDCDLNEEDRCCDCCRDWVK